MIVEMPRPQRVDTVAPSGLTVELAASPGECVAIAARLGVPAVRSFTARFHLLPVQGGAVAARGTLTARLVRECVVSLDEFETTQREAFTVRFVPAGTEAPDPDPESEDEIPYDGGVIDLGEAAVEQLALDLDPYPRKKGAELPADPAAEAASPFAALLKLRREE